MKKTLFLFIIYFLNLTHCMEPKPDFDYLYLAICKNDTALLHYALGRGMDINCVDKDGQGGLFHAFNRGAQAIPFFKYLVEAGANLQCYK